MVVGGARAGPDRYMVSNSWAHSSPIVMAACENRLFQADGEVSANPPVAIRRAIASWWHS